MVEVVIKVEVVYAAVDRQVLLTVTVPVGATVRDALLKSGLNSEFLRWIWPVVRLGSLAK